MSGMTRRAVIVGAAAAVPAVAAQAAPVPKGPAKLPTTFTIQTEWRWCKKCEGLFYAGGGKNGACPDGKEHDPSESGLYALQVGGEGGQSGWRRCKKCEGLFFGAEKRRGNCPAGKEHDPDDTVYTTIHAG